ncbi:hypothetical protein FB451DRAFT_1170930 [Mycena latifolia]|nr:hypothetical protein FB451DRAFT_1170930 [Mycena latifolia]
MAVTAVARIKDSMVLAPGMLVKIQLGNHGYIPSLQKPEDWTSSRRISHGAHNFTTPSSDEKNELQIQFAKRFGAASPRAGNPVVMALPLSQIAVDASQLTPCALHVVEVNQSVHIWVPSKTRDATSTSAACTISENQQYATHAERIDTLLNEELLGKPRMVDIASTQVFVNGALRSNDHSHYSGDTCVPLPPTAIVPRV